MQIPETIPPTDANRVGEAIRAIAADPSTLAVLYVHQGMRIERLMDDLRTMGAELAWWKSECRLAQAQLSAAKQELKYAKDRIDVLGGDAC